jgi:hypothetical protein
LNVQKYSSFAQSGGTLLLTDGIFNGGTADLGGTEVWQPGSQFTNFGHATFSSDTGSKIVRNVAVTVAWSNTLSSFADSIVTFDSSQHLASLNVVNGTVVLSAGGNKVLNTGSLQMGGKIDLNDNGLIWQYDTTRDLSPAGVVRNLIASARYAGGTWRGMGITSSMADAQHFGVGYWDRNQGVNPTLPVFKTEPFNAAQILAARTYYGDATGDGKVDVTDLATLAQHWQLSGYWYEGDFNYDGSVDVTDLGLLATNWQAGVSNALAMTLEQELATLGLSDVPEPTTLAIVASLTALFSRCSGGRRR